MSVRTIHILVLSLVLAVIAAPSMRAEEGKGGHKGPVAFILKHADDLKLTDEQKTKLAEVGKEAPSKDNREAIMAKINAILTPEQQTQVKELREKEKKPK